MPIAFDPDARLWVRFPEDRDKPGAAEFAVKPFTMRGADRWRARMREIADTAKTEADSRAAVLAELANVVTAWRNIEGERIDDILTDAEFYSMAWQLPDWATLAEYDLKKSASPSASAGAASAGNAPAVNALTHPPSEPPSS